MESSFSGDPRRRIRAATHAPSSRSASGAKSDPSAPQRQRGRPRDQVGPRDRQEPQLAIGLFHAQGVAAVATDDLDSLAVERMNGQSDRRDRPAPEHVRPRARRRARLGFGSALGLSVSGLPRRIEPMSRSAKGFCHGLRGAVRTSRDPHALHSVRETLAVDRVAIAEEVGSARCRPGTPPRSAGPSRPRWDAR